MSENDEKKRISKEIAKQNKLGEERINITQNLIKNLEYQKKLEKEHLDLVDQHQEYWSKELEKTKKSDEKRYAFLKQRLKLEKKIRDKIQDHIKHIDKEIEIQKKQGH